MDQNALWQSILNDISNEVNPASFTAWFQKLKLIKIKDQTVYIEVPMPMHKTVLVKNYFNLIDQTFYKYYNQNFEFEFLLKDEIPDDFFEIPKAEVSVPVESLEIKEVELEEQKQEEVWESNLIPELNFDNYIVGDSNRLAKTAGMIVAEQPGKVHNPLFIYGKSGLGKTHLMHAIGNYIVQHSHKKVLYTTSEMFKDEYVNIINSNQNNVQDATNFKKKYRDIDVLIIDDIQYLVGAEKTQQEFFHTFNNLHQSNKQIIISSDRSPDDLKLLEERLRSRFMWGLPVDIYPPDYELRCKIIRAKLAKMSISAKIDEDVIEYIANSCPNDVRFLEGTLNRLMAYAAMIVPPKVDLNFAVEALADFVNNNIYKTNSIESIQKAVADYYHITIADLKGKRRSNDIAYPRQIAMYLARTLTEENLNRIGLEFGGRDHSTVIHACEKITQDLKTNLTLEQTLKEIKNIM